MKGLEVHLVRHASTGQAWDPRANVGISVKGRRQASELASSYSEHSEFQIISSPLLRALETAKPLAKKTSSRVKIEPRLGEIPSPTEFKGSPMDWLTGVLTLNWDDMPRKVLNWKVRAAEAVLEITSPSLVFTHYLTISAIYSELSGDKRVNCYESSNCTPIILQKISSNWRWPSN